MLVRFECREVLSDFIVCPCYDEGEFVDYGDLGELAEGELMLGLEVGKWEYPSFKLPGRFCDEDVPRRRAQARYGFCKRCGSFLYAGVCIRDEVDDTSSLRKSAVRLVKACRRIDKHDVSQISSPEKQHASMLAHLIIRRYIPNLRRRLQGSLQSREDRVLALHTALFSKIPPTWNVVRRL